MEVQMLDRVEKKIYAPESLKTQKARKKLQESFEKQDAKITREALKATVEKIHKWISDHSDKRILIKGKPIKLFANNEGAAKTSSKVDEIAQKLQAAYAIPSHSFNADLGDSVLDSTKVTAAPVA